MAAAAAAAKAAAAEAAAAVAAAVAEKEAEAERYRRRVDRYFRPCERHPVTGYTCLASYYAIGTYSVLGAKPILGCISRFGRFTGTPRDYLRDRISDISFEIICEIGAPISLRSGYCPLRRPE